MFIEVFKDYIDYLHSLSSILTGDLTFFELIKASLIYVTKSVGVLFWYIISFKWLVGFTEIPALFKQNYYAILDAESILTMRFELETDRGFFSFLETGRLNSNNLGTGFLNSFFLTLPLSVPQLLTLRALLVSGVQPGVFSALGTLVGQFFFFACVLFGFEFLLVPWVSIQPILIVVGSFLVINLVYRLVHNPPRIGVEIVQRKTLFKYFRTTLFLSWMEQICIYSYFGNLTVTSSPTVLQTSDSNFLFSTGGYLLGLTIGSVIWTVLWGFGCIAVRNFLYDRVFIGISTFRLTERIHHGCLVFLTTLCLSSYPYYGMDYVAGQSMGFIANDQGMEVGRQESHYKIGTLDNMDRTYVNQDEETLLGFEFFYQDLNRSNPPSQGEYSQESYNLGSERHWKNRFVERTRVTDETAKRQLVKINLPKLLKPALVPDYDSLRIQYEPEEDRDNDDEEDLDKLPPFEKICDEFLRPDVYMGYKDVMSGLYGPEVEVHREFRDRYFANPVYKSLLRFDMYPFLLGTNPQHNVTAEDEYQLYERRAVLQAYSNSILNYKASKTKPEIGFARQVYNQQFKGSLNVIRQFNFAKIHENVDRDSTSDFFDEERNNKLNGLKVLKYDQLLYNSVSEQGDIRLHEELEDLIDERFGFPAEIANQSAPLYIGWDGALRKFLVKTNIVPNQMVTGDLVYSDPNAIYDDEGELITNGSEEKTKDGENRLLSQKKGQKTFSNSIPTYYSFQAWSPASENSKLDSKLLNLSTSSLTDKELENLKITFGLVELSYKNDPLDTTPPLTDKEKDDIQDVLQHLPHYNWFWKKADIDFKMSGYLELGNTTPPQLDGFAWPGIRDPVIIRKVISKMPINRNDYLLD